MRVLVAIAHHGTKNRPFLLRMIESFRRMEHDVEVVVVCEERKDLPSDIEQIVGLPSSDPWSLPFAHRPVFVERVADYDLFVYSEDDTLIEQRHLDTFIRLQSRLPDDMITGFMRFEEYPDGSRSYSTIHSHYRWLPNSLRRIDGRTFARFTNDHAACYALTRDQLTRAIASGGFAVAPHAGRYDMLVSAATDVYTQCGMTKYLCIDEIDDQLVHHMPNIYLGKLGVDKWIFQHQINALKALAGTSSTAEDFLTPESKTLDAFWDRHSFPNEPTALVRSFRGRPPRRVLTIGGTTGDLETALMEVGHEVASVPADPVFDHVLAARGIGTMPVGGRSSDQAVAPFDFVVAIDALPYVEDPVALLAALRSSLVSTGRVIVSVPDHRRYRLRNHVQRGRRVSLPVGYMETGVHRTDRRVLRDWLRSAGYRVAHIHHRTTTRREPFGEGGWRGELWGNAIVAVAVPDR